MQEDNLLSQDMQDTLTRPEWEDKEDQYNAVEDNGGPSHEPCTKVLDELDLYKLLVLRRMATKDADPTQLQEKVQKLKASPHQQ